MDINLFRRLKDETCRQRMACRARDETQNDWTTSDSTISRLDHMGLDYQTGLYDFERRLEDILKSGGQHGFDDVRLRPPEMWWQIPAFCEPSIFDGQPSIYVDPDRSKMRRKAAHTINTGGKATEFADAFWKSSELNAWAVAETSSLLLVQGDFQTITNVDGIAVDLVEFLQKNSKTFVYVFNAFTYGTEYVTLTAEVVLRQIAIQILQKNTKAHFVSKLALVVERFRTASSSADWFGVVEMVLVGAPSLYIIIDLGKFTLQSEFWAEDFPRLFGKWSKLKGSPAIKVVLLSCQPLSSNDSSVPTVHIQTHGGPPSVQRRMRRQLYGSFGEREPNYFPLLPAMGVVKEGREEASRPPPDLKSGPSISEKAVAKEPRLEGPCGWFFEMKAFETCVDASRKEPDILHPRVKVAVLDTGVDLTHPDISKGLSDARLKFFDFVEDSNEMKDADGHGTHCASLVLKYAPNAEVYIGRVFRRSQADESSCATLTRAIRHAADVWKVDIISLSLGFTEDQGHDSDQLREEIRKASGNSILIFSAAANNTSNEPKPIRFPARMKEVICVFSSNSFGRPSDFNPKSKYDRPNLTFPGEKVQGAWPSSLSDKECLQIRGITYKHSSGTSCSTSLATAVAAGVLEFAWQERVPSVRRVKLLKHYSGMTQVFLSRMVDDYKMGDNSYHYVKPWKLISTSCRRDEIPVLISDALDNIDG